MKSFITRNHDRDNQIYHFLGQVEGTFRVTIEPYQSKRSLEQNDMLWALLTDVSEQVEWYGRKLSKEDWKTMFTAALKKAEAVPGIDGGFVVLGLYTSKMSVTQMNDLIELILAFGAEYNVQWSEP